MNPFNVFLKLRSKKKCLLAEIDFLVKCRTNHVFPKFISNGKSYSGSGYYMKKCHLRNLNSLLRAAIKDSRCKLAKCELELYSMHLELMKSNHTAIWEPVDIISDAVSTRNYEIKLTVLNKKFDDLMGNKHPKTTNIPISTETILDQEEYTAVTPFKQELVINKSSVVLNEMEHASLNLGFNFALPPQSDKVLEDLICDLDYGISRRTPQNSKEDLKHSVKNIITENIPLETSFKNPSSSLKTLAEKDIYVVRADKGGKLVILDKQTYDTGIDKLLEDKTTYKVINQGPTTGIVNAIKNTVSNCASIPPSLQSKLIPSKFNLPCIYALPKIHKPDMPFRPIVSNIGSITYPTAKYVTSQLQFLNTTNKYTINNSITFVEKLKSVPLNSSDIIISFDVISLYTNVPTDEALDCLQTKLAQKSHLTALECSDIFKLTSTCVHNNFFKHREKTYKQCSGLAMGSPISPILANIFMDSIESKILEVNSSYLKPKCWFRYFDDVFSVWPHGINTLPAFLDRINNIHPNIQFTIEYECERKLPFLDVLVERKSDHFITSVYRKPYSVCAPPHIMSKHPWSQKMSVFNCFVNRALKISSTECHKQTELSFLKNVAVDRGYDSTIIDRAVRKFQNKEILTNSTTLSSQKTKPTKFIAIPFIPKLSNKIGKELTKHGITPIYKPHRKISNIFSNFKTKIPRNRDSGVYRIPCKDCGKVYIGQTSRSFYLRCSEHRRFCNRDKPLQVDKSAVALHISESDHEIDWDNAKLIRPCKNHLLNTYELLHIYKNRDSLLNRKDDNKFPHVWHSLVT